MVDFAWKKGEPPVPGCSTPKYSARWTGVLVVPATGAAGIGIEADDGAQLTIDGHRLFEFEKPQNRYVPGMLAPGAHPMEVTYHNRLAGGRCRLFWILLDKPDQEVTVPMSALFHAEAAGTK